MLFRPMGCDPTFEYENTRAWGMSAKQLMPDDKIIVRVGKDATSLPTYYSGAPFPNNPGSLTPLPCRVKVLKVK